MKKPYLLHMFNPTKNVSPFDVNMAYEAGFDGVIPYAEVTLEDIHSLTQDTIFSRDPAGVKCTGIFIGGREFGLANDMLGRARVAMVPPFEVSVFADPSGAITTAASMLAAIESLLAKQGRSLADERFYVFGGTGPVGICLGILASTNKAKVYLASHRGKQVAEELVLEHNGHYKAQMCGVGSRSEEETRDAVADATVIVSVAKAGVRVLSKEQLAAADHLLVAADANAVPPAGIEGVGVKDFGTVLNFIPSGKALGIGALAVGDIKYKTHLRIFENMQNSERPLYIGHQEAFEVAREIVREKFTD
ncbi:MAG: NAD(P)-dependent methylenetetrahydromethanopterin dehydrogenase [Candidatus Eutrophobiaceae bacterium]